MPAKKSASAMRILSVDIGGSHIKATVLDHDGNLLQEYIKVKTPVPANPADVVDAIKELAAKMGKFDCVSVGFPGYVRNGTIGTAPNLDTSLWAGKKMDVMIKKALKKPAKVINDADMQAVGIAKGKGLEMLITLGTGMGTALILDGVLLPHLELSHHPITGKKDYDQYIGEAALKKIGVERWNGRMKRVLEVLKTVVNFDTLYIGGGNAPSLNFVLDKNIKLVSNRDGIKGGARLWAHPAKNKNQKK